MKAKKEMKSKANISSGAACDGAGSKVMDEAHPVTH